MKGQLISMRKGFTLVELLAVIVILSIIMIIAIPSVLGTMETAKRKTFAEFVSKVYTTAQSTYLAQSLSGELPDQKCVQGVHNGPCYVVKTSLNNLIEYFYEIQSDLGLPSTGGYKGFVCIVPSYGEDEETEFLISVYDSNYITKSAYTDSEGVVRHRYFVNYTLYGEPDVTEVHAYSNDHYSEVEGKYMGTETSKPSGISEFLETRIIEKK